MSLLKLLLAAEDKQTSLSNKKPLETRSFLDVNTLFKTTLYQGNGASRYLTTNVDLTSGGLIIAYNRQDNTPVYFFDYVRGWNKSLITNSRGAQVDNGTTLITSVDSTGLTITSNSVLNNTSGGFVIHSFKKAARFLDIVTYTGDGTSSKTLSHALTIKPGLIIIKKLDNLSSNNSDNWFVWNSYSGLSYFNETSDQSIEEDGTILTDTVPTDTNFYIGSKLNKSSTNYIAYLFADDRSDTGVIRSGLVFNLTPPSRGFDYFDWETQFTLEKHIDLTSYTTTTSWEVKDSYRGNGKLPYVKKLISAVPELSPNGTLDVSNAGLIANVGTNSYIDSLYQYLAIRSPELITPTVGTDVLYIENVAQADLQKTSSSPFEPDLIYSNTRATTPNSAYVNTLMLKNYSVGSITGNSNNFQTNTTAVPAVGYIALDNDGKNINMGFGWDSTTYGAFIYYLFKRAKGFLDTVNFVGTFKANTLIRHKLEVAPELIIIKCNNATANYIIGAPILGTNYYMQLASTAAKVANTLVWSNTAPTSEFFTIGNLAASNTLNNEYSAMLFASLAGISKIGVYTGNGTNQDIDCGFTTGARFVLIKSHNATGNWTLHDTVRGMTTGNDVYNNLNTASAEVKTKDNINTLSTGFNVVQNTTSNLNYLSREYLYLAIA